MNFYPNSPLRPECGANQNLVNVEASPSIPVPPARMWLHYVMHRLCFDLDLCMASIRCAWCAERLDAQPSAACASAAMQPDGEVTPYRLRDLSALRAKLAARTARSGGATSHHLPDTLASAAAAADAALCEARSFGVQVRSLWAQDGTKGGRAARKRALTDYFKRLRLLGMQPPIVPMMPAFGFVAVPFCSTFLCL